METEGNIQKFYSERMVYGNGRNYPIGLTLACPMMGYDDNDWKIFTLKGLTIILDPLLMDSRLISIPYYPNISDGILLEIRHDCDSYSLDCDGKKLDRLLLMLSTTKIIYPHYDYNGYVLVNYGYSSESNLDTTKTDTGINPNIFTKNKSVNLTINFILPDGTIIPVQPAWIAEYGWTLMGTIKSIPNKL